MKPLTILFISSELKGEDLIRTVKAEGCFVLLLTEEKLRDKNWPYESIDEAIFTPDLKKYQDVVNTVTYLNRGRHIDHILPLDEFEVELVAILREHLQLPGMGVTAIRKFRDKLTMRQAAHDAGILVPEFIGIKNYDDLRDYMARVPAPRMLKPRMEAGSMGITKTNSDEEVWRALDRLGDRQSYYLLEQFIPGDVFHADSITVAGKVKFVSVQKYGAPPMDVYQGGGVFNTRILPRDSEDVKAIQDINEKVIKALGMQNGVTHGEYIKAHADGRFYFLEIAARVGGAFIADLVEAGTGINLWREWGRLEVAHLKGETYKLPKVKKEYAGLLVTLAKNETPNLSAYDAKEIVWKAKKPYHAALIVASKDYEKVENILNKYTQRFVYDFLAVGKPVEATRTGYTSA